MATRKRIQCTTKNTSAEKRQRLSRTHTVFFVFVFIFAVIAVKLYVVQVLHHQKYEALADNQHIMQKRITSFRGDIFLKDKHDVYALGVNKEYFLAFLSPDEVAEDQLSEVAQNIVSVFDISYEEVMDKLVKRKDKYEVIQHKVERQQKEQVEKMQIAGVHFEPEYYRFYPGDTLAAQIVGFVGSDGEEYVGRYGIEASFDDVLRGSDGKIVQKRDARGGWLTTTDRSVSEKKDGADIYLTIDYTVQYEVERILREEIERVKADRGSIVVMDPQTGNILAMANYPTFSPGQYSDVEDIAVFRNSIVSDEYECGSVFKPLTMAMGLDAGKVQPHSTYVDTGSVSAGGFTIRNSEDKVYGHSTMTKVLEESINTGVIHVENLVGNAKFKEYVERFGFGAVTGIDLPAEADGNISNLERINSNVEFYTASFGQGITVTPLQVAVAYAALANGGFLMEPHIVAKTVHADGHEEVVQPHKIHRVISQKASEDIGVMLRSVVTNGHGKRADVPGYVIGGKTGTAQVANVDKKGYDDSQTIGTFAGYGPLDDPQFVIVVKIDNPKEVIWAESSAAPTFGKVMKYLLDFYQIAPTEAVQEKVEK